MWYIGLLNLWPCYYCLSLSFNHEVRQNKSRYQSSVLNVGRSNFLYHLFNLIAFLYSFNFRIKFCPYENVYKKALLWRMWITVLSHSFKVFNWKTNAYSSRCSFLFPSQEISLLCRNLCDIISPSCIGFGCDVRLSRA